MNEGTLMTTSRRFAILWSVVAFLAIPGTTVFGQVFEFQTPDGTAEAGEMLTVPMILDSTAGSEIVGWSYGVCHDPAVISIESVELGSAITSILGPAGPFIFLLEIEADGYAISLLLDSLPFTTLPVGVSEISVANYVHQLSPGESTVMTACSTIGTPPVDLVAVEPSAVIIPGTPIAGTWTGFATAFVRGDVNDDDGVNLADAVFLLAELFAGGDGGLCPLAKDINADGTINIADPVDLLNALFAGGSFPPAPFPDCGSVPGQTLADCPTFVSCP